MPEKDIMANRKKSMFITYLAMNCEILILH